jgi:acyl-CoA synthetase (AMP-forming)/AMP-acid ligase II
MRTADYEADKVTDVKRRASKWRLGHALDVPAETTPDSPALIVGADRRRITYAELVELVVDHCAALRRRGLRPGDVVALQASNGIGFIVALLGAARAGIVVAPLDPALPLAERRMRADRIGARAVVTDTERPSVDAPYTDCPEWQLKTTAMTPKPVMELAAAEPARVTASPTPGLSLDDALLMFTSGTTGTPKLVPWTHANLAAAIAGIAGAYELGDSDATIAAMPLFHGHGLVATLLATLATGGAVVLPARGRFSAHTFWDDMRAVNATWYTAVPTIHQILLDRAATDFPADYHGPLRFIRSCSAPLPPATVQRIEATFGAPVLAAYGMTETTHQASTVLPNANGCARLHTVGTPTGLSVRIVRDDGSAAPPEATGEIWLRGPSVVRGYLDDSAATASTFVDGWVRTGDLGAVDSHGILTVRGRIKELINRGGEKISPEHVEEVLVTCPGVARAAVFGVPDALYGERVAALVVPDDGVHLDLDDLISVCRQSLAPFEIPERIEVTNQLPLTAKGSVDRSKLAEALGEGVPR